MLYYHQRPPGPKTEKGMDMTYKMYLAKSGKNDSKYNYHLYLLTVNSTYKVLNERMRRQYINTLYKYRFCNLGG